MPSSVADSFAALLRADPTAPVAWTAAGVRSRADLHEAACRSERVLAAVAPGGRVGLCLSDGFQLLAGFLALCRRGDAALLLDAADPRAPRCDLAARFGAHGVLADWPDLRFVPSAGQPVPAGALRAIKLTSGSTDEPRAIAVDDEQLLADATALERSMGIGAGDRVLAAVPMSFSYGVGNLLVPALAAGRQLVLPARHPAGLLQAMRRGAPTVLPAVPALLRGLLQGAFVVPESLRLTVSAGDLLAPGVARAWRARCGQPVHTFYGSTESGGICYDRTGTAAERSTVGTPVDGVDVSVAEDGRVRVRSPAVGTAIDGSGNPGGGTFLAPDLGQLVDGELRLAGRAGAVFAIGGHKVDPRELERIIADLPQVTDVAVVPWRDEHGRAGCAAVVAARGIAERDVRRHCARFLLPAKVPRWVVVTAELPRSSRGKLLRCDLERLLQGHGHGPGQAAGDHP